MNDKIESNGTSLKSYLLGFGLALVLTAIPFGLVASNGATRTTTLLIITITAIIQVFVHLRFFLHLDFKTTPRENMLAMIFAVILIVILGGGTLWIMFNLNSRMGMF
ncbi:MAG: cytochrome o ubiquinol oxidase subunit IV [Alphaproteobacteria bacterium]